MLAPEITMVFETLLKGIDVEKKHRFINVQGKARRFDAFVRLQLKSVVKHIFNEEVLPVLIQQFQRYDMMDLAGRMHAVERLEQFSHALLAPPSPSVHAKTVEESCLPVGQWPVSKIKGVGPRLESLLTSLGLNTVEALLRYAPRQYIDYQQRQKIMDVMEGDFVTLIATVKRVESHELKNRKLLVLRLLLQDESGKLSTQRFFGTRQRAMLEAMKTKFPKGTEVLISGKVKWDSFNHCPQLDNAEIQSLSYDDGEEAPLMSEGGSLILPVYPLTQGLNLKSLRRAIQNALDAFGADLPDTLPPKIRESQKLLNLTEALHTLHFPINLDAAQRAKHRFGFEELFMLQLRLALMRHLYKQDVQGQSIPVKADGLVHQFTAELPYQLTTAQVRSFQEICDDLASPLPMNRLLHGDVGSGKTVIAMLTLLVAIENGFQGAMMAPTEILAEQHYQGFVEALAPLGIKVALLVGKLGAKAKREVLQSLANGQIHVVVGTHALIQKSVLFHRLGVVVVDEQHRFGVKQRLALRHKGVGDQMPELLSMTATPIPRTLAMTLHGDLDVSVLDELPPGRSPIITRLLSPAQRKEAYDLIETQLLYGRQVYIVFPLIEESETLSAKAASVEYERLRQEVFPHRRVGLMHGKLKSEEKEAVMHAFSSGDLEVLVSTTVVEVGVNVPNASVILIENAERFGLAQLHQLRGRVGRAEHQSYCLLMIQQKNQDSLQRLEIMESSSNGFVIAEHDLAIRGPGDYVGLRQSGLPELQFTNLVDDYELLAQSRALAFQCLEDLGLEGLKKEHPLLWERLQQSSEEEIGLLSSG
ncbi:MAG: ATP-dependent DNA helicase RecG [Vampirovibrio sp.]